VRLGLRMLVTVPASGSIDCVLRVVESTHIGVRGARASLLMGWIADYGDKGRAPYAGEFILLGSPRPLLSMSGRATEVGALADYLPTGTAGRLVVQGDVYATECHRADNFCPAGRYRPFGVAHAHVWVAARPQNRVCRAVTGASSEVAIDSSVHHHRVLATLDMPTPKAGCGRWRLAVWARDAAASTNPFVISTDGSYSDLAVFPVSRPARS
jgi:hypothetical protein